MPDLPFVAVPAPLYAALICGLVTAGSFHFTAIVAGLVAARRRRRD